MMDKKYFTLEEANLLLPILSKELVALQATKRQFDDKYMELQELKAGWAQASSLNKTSNKDKDNDPFFTQECELEFIQIEAKSLIQSIHHKGVELKDIETGLVDFPAKLDDKEVLFCWRLGESEIAYYHGFEDGFAGRKPL